MLNQTLNITNLAMFSEMGVSMPCGEGTSEWVGELLSGSAGGTRCARGAEDTDVIRARTRVQGEGANRQTNFHPTSSG